MFGRLNAIGVQAATALIIVSCSQSGTTQSIAAPSTLTAPERTALSALEARPLVIPQRPADGICPDGPQSAATPFGAQSAKYLAGTGGMLYGTGPVYGLGGPEVDGQLNTFYDVTFFTDPTVRRVVLIRGQDLGGHWKVVMVGPWAAGALVGSDTIGGRQVTLRSELALPAETAPTKPGVAPGWGIWEVRIGISKKATNSCIGFQIDTMSGTEVWVVV